MCVKNVALLLGGDICTSHINDWIGCGCAYQAVGKSGVLGVRIPSSADWF